MSNLANAFFGFKHLFIVFFFIVLCFDILISCFLITTVRTDE